MMAQKQLLLVGGPNGAGKTTFATQFLAQRPGVYLGADAIAAELSPHDPYAARIEAGRQFLHRLDELLAGDQDFIIESTLAGLSLRHALECAREAEFEVIVAFVFIPTPDFSVARVAERVRKGGHNVPETDVRRRFTRTAVNFWNVYRQLADEWQLFYNGDGNFIRTVTGRDDRESIYQPELYSRFLGILNSVQP